MAGNKRIDKKKLYDLCRAHLEDRIREAREAIESLQAAANEETKSSFGDKYETGRAMMQLEIEKYTQQLSDFLKLKSTLERIDITKQSAQAMPGSIVATDNGIFFISVSAGQFVIDDIKILTISVSSPIGARLLNLKASETFTFNSRIYNILDVY